MYSINRGGVLPEHHLDCFVVDLLRIFVLGGLLNPEHEEKALSASRRYAEAVAVLGATLEHPQATQIVKWCACVRVEDFIILWFTNYSHHNHKFLKCDT